MAILMQNYTCNEATSSSWSLNCVVFVNNGLGWLMKRTCGLQQSYSSHTKVED